jgi:hypothetical protein
MPQSTGWVIPVDSSGASSKGAPIRTEEAATVLLGIKSNEGTGKANEENTE